MSTSSSVRYYYYETIIDTFQQVICIYIWIINSFSFLLSYNRVAVRVRPLAEQEFQQSCCISFIPDQPQITVGHEQRSFTFDYAYPPSSDQHQVYDTSITPLLHKFVDGYNSTVLAYG